MQAARRTDARKQLLLTAAAVFVAAFMLIGLSFLTFIVYYEDGAPFGKCMLAVALILLLWAATVAVVAFTRPKRHYDWLQRATCLVLAIAAFYIYCKPPAIFHDAAAVAAFLLLELAAILMVLAFSRSPRQWLQLHLSTCVLVVFSAAVLLWLNFRAIEETSAAHASVTLYITKTTAYGWPRAARSYYEHWTEDLVAKKSEIEHREEWDLMGIGVNATCAAGVWIALAGLSLYLIRREDSFKRALAFRRRWYQFRPTTTLLLTSTALVLRWANTIDWAPPTNPYRGFELHFSQYGWPVEWWCVGPHWGWLLLAALSWLAILAGVAFVSEWVLRWLERRSTPQNDGEMQKRS